MSDFHRDEAWNLYREVLKERDQARAQLDTLRLVALDLMRERDHSRALAHDYDALLHRVIAVDTPSRRDLAADLDHLRHRLHRAGWLPDTPALPGEPEPAPRCPHCGLCLLPGQACLLCGPDTGREE